MHKWGDYIVTSLPDLTHISTGINSFISKLPGKPSDTHLEAINKTNEFIKDSMGDIARVKGIKNNNLELAILDPSFAMNLKYIESQIIDMFNSTMGNTNIKTIRTSVVREWVTESK